MEIKPMKLETQIEQVVKMLADRGTEGGVTPDEALKFTQAALNLAHVQATLVGAAAVRANTPK
jgi:hypothetical protein